MSCRPFRSFAEPFLLENGNRYMSMPTAPPRKRFQFHLSTAIVLMFVAGALMWANMQPHFLRPILWSANGVEEYLTLSEKEFRIPNPDVSYRYYGWPRFVVYSVRIPNALKESE